MRHAIQLHPNDVHASTMRQSARHVLLPLMIGISVLTFGCSKYTDSGQTVGQKIDTAIDKTNEKIAAAGDKVAAAGDKMSEKAAAVGDKVQEKIEKAGAAVNSAGESISNKAGNAVSKAGDAVFAKTDQVGSIIDDSAITASIKADFLKDPGLSALAIEVNTVKGEVTLKGDVSTEVRKQRAEGIVRHIVGVTKINNQLRVTG